MKKLPFFMTIALIISMSSVCSAADIAAGKTKSEGCVGCHGLNGKSNNPNYPNIGGQKKAYLAKAIKDYRDGKRQDAMMNPMVTSLTDEDIENLAAYYSSLK